MATIKIHEAKTNLSKLLVRVESGEEIIIARAGKAVARLIPVRKAKFKRSPGSAKGRIIMDKSFLEPLPDELIKSFEE
jgi:prevent-host-death family protein